MTSGHPDELRNAVNDYVAAVTANGGYLPAVATLLRLIADELADRFPDDANGGNRQLWRNWEE